MRLIDVLNKIANGELKEGTKVKWDIFEYTYKKGDCYDEYLERKVDKFNYVDIIDDMALRHLNTEVELIEPEHFPDDRKVSEPTECEHEWKIGGIRDTIDPLEVVAFQHCEKCGMTKIMETKKQENHKEAEPEEPTDNTKIAELNVKGLCEIFEGKHTVNPNLAFSTALNKLNEVIRKINEEG